jgi:peptide/nickel transport system permease protein
MLSVLTSDQFVDGGWSDSGYSNPKYDELYQQQQIATDPNERQKIVWQMQEMAFNDRPYIVYWYPDTLQAYRSDRFKNFLESPVIEIQGEKSLRQVGRAVNQEFGVRNAGFSTSVFRTPSFRSARSAPHIRMSRRDYFFRKVVFALVTLLIVFTINFLLFRILPGDPVRAVIGRNVRITREVQQALREQFGLDRPLFPDQYLNTLGQYVQGNLGVSWSLRRPVNEVLITKLGNTLLLVTLGQFFSIILGVSLGLLAGWKRKTKIDVSALTFSLIMWAVPTFWLGIMLLALGSQLGLPYRRHGRPQNIGKPFLEVLPDVARHLALPTLTFTLIYLGEYMLIMRSSILEVLSEDYILTAKAKGMSHWQILRKHAMKNAMLPIVTLIALNLGFTVSGAIYIETVFSYDGLGILSGCAGQTGFSTAAGRFHAAGDRCYHRQHGGGYLVYVSRSASEASLRRDTQQVMNNESCTTSGAVSVTSESLRRSRMGLVGAPADYHAVRGISGRC